MRTALTTLGKLRLRLASLALLLALAPACAAQPSVFEGSEIFVIGDSISTGYGALGHGPDCAPLPETHAPDLTYAALLAKQLNATLVVDAVAGRGLVHNVEGQDAPTVKAKLLDDPQILTGAYSGLQPALVMVHIGTNDNYRNDPGPAFEETYEALLETIAQAYPEARILALFGPALSGEDAARATGSIHRAIDAASAATGRNIQFLQLSYDDNPDTAIGCQWHPGTSTHVKMAKAIATLLSDAVGR